MASTSTSLPLHLEIRHEPQERLRIPIELQAVFLTSQQGHHQLCRAPPNQLAATTFRSARSAANGCLHDCSVKGGGSLSTESMTGSSSSISSGSACSDETRSHVVPTGSISRKRSASITAVGATASPPRARRNLSMQLSPQIYLDALIRSRGYGTERFKGLETAYSNAPTPLQQASYHVNLIGLVRQRDASSLRRIMGSGISPNPCNRFGESLLHAVCRRGDAECLKAMLDAGSALNVCDDRGRTPLHDACWVPTPCFDVVDMILERDPRLLYVVDCRGSSPLQYIPKPQWPEWLQFLEARKDVYWPPRNLKLEGPQPPPPLAMLPPNSCPIPDPPHSLSVELAKQVAAGQLAVLKDEPSQHTGTGIGGPTMDVMIGSSLSIITHRHAVPLHPLLRQAMIGNLHPNAAATAAATTRTGEALGVEMTDPASMMMMMDEEGPTVTHPVVLPTLFDDAVPDKVSASSSSTSASDHDDDADDADSDSDSFSSDSLDSSDDDCSSSSSDEDGDACEDALLDEVIRISQQRRQKCHPMQ